MSPQKPSRTELARATRKAPRGKTLCRHHLFLLFYSARSFPSLQPLGHNSSITIIKEKNVPFTEAFFTVDIIIAVNNLEKDGFDGELEKERMREQLQNAKRTVTFAWVVFVGHLVRTTRCKWRLATGLDASGIK